MMEKKRIQWVDFAKGIAILLVIMGHTVENHVIRGAIFSFHMPLFFALSGYTSKCAVNCNDLISTFKKTARSLLLPAAILWLVTLPFFYWSGRLDYSFMQLLLSFIYASGTPIFLGAFEIPMMGMMWFLVALFIIRNLYNWINYITTGKGMTIISVIVSLTGVFIGRYIFLPFSLDAAMASFVFFHFGMVLKGREIVPTLPKCLCAFIVWGGIMFAEYYFTYSYFEIAVRRYPLVPACFIAAIAGSLLCIYGCVIICEKFENSIVDILCFVGENSIILFAVHRLDTIWFPYISGDINVYLSLFIRLSVDLLLMYISVSIINHLQKQKP